MLIPKKSGLLLTLAVIAITFIKPEKLFAGIGDTTVVQTLRYDTTMRTGVFQFPDDSTKTYEKIIMRYGLRCKSGLISDGTNTNRGCGEWDYNCNTFIVDSTQTDSLHKTGKNYVISNFTDTTYIYTSQPVYNYVQYNQQQVIHTSTISQSTATPATGTDSLQHPLYSNTKVQRSQYLWKASELTTAGLTAGNITGLQLNALTAGNIFSNLRIQLKHTNKSTLNDNGPDVSGFTEVYFLNTSFSGTGVNSFNFSTPFNWDGTSNIIVDFSYSLPASSVGSEIEGHDAAFNAGITTSQENSSLAINGAGNFIQLDPSINDSITDQITIAFWAYGDPAKLPAAGTCIIYGVDNANNRQVNIHLPWTDSNIYWDCGYATGGFDRIQKAATAAEFEGKWNFWTFTKNATTGSMKIYLNGVVWMSDVGKTKLIDISDFKFGVGIGGANSYYGMTDELSIWNKELDITSINNIMYHDITPANPNYSKLLAYYKMDENAGNIVNNSGPAGGTAVVYNPSWREFRGNDLFRNYSLTTFRPDLTFVKGVYTDSVITTTVLDSVLRAPNSVIQYQVTGNQLNVIDTTYSWLAGPNYILNSSGAVVDTVTVLPQDTLNIVTLDYYSYRPMYFELINFITPYGINLDLEGLNGRTYEFDVTDFTPVLKGNRYLAMDGGKYQEDNDIQFVFYEGIPPRTVKSISQIWPNATWGEVSYNNVVNNVVFEPRTIQLDSTAAQYKVRSCISGHGQQGEFTARNHTIRLNNAINYTKSVWTECAANPIYPQGGTWVYDRAGWCPGAAVVTNEFELTPNVTPGQTITLDYSLPYVANPGASSYRVNNQLVTYGPANHSLDASVAYIKSPSKRPEFLRFQPNCDDPVIVIRNTGSTPLTSLTITYGRVNGTMSTYNWSGNLNFLDTQTVVLPANDWQSSNTDKFTVALSAPNGGTDEYFANDTMTNDFHVPPILPDGLVFDFRTNNNTSNSYTLKDASGTIILNRPGSLINHTYFDTVSLTPGCYSLYMNDAGDDGLSWWANSQQGTGYFQIWSTSGAFIHAFDPDFGDNIFYQFTVGFTLPVQEVNSVKPSLNVFPNPSDDHIVAKVSAPVSSKALLSITDIVGHTVWSQKIMMTGAEERVYINTSDLNSGVYFVKLETEKYKVEEKMIISR